MKHSNGSDQTASHRAGVTIHLVGTLRVTAEDGSDLTPRGAKARGLLGLLALTSDHRRGRRWIEAKLWSERGQEQASGSLRQTLTEIRRSFGDHAEVLGADRDNVWLDEARLGVDVLDDPEAARTELEQGRDLMEGLSIRDPEFEDWLRGERMRLAADARPSAFIPAGELTDPGREPICTIFVDTDTATAPAEALAVEICVEKLGRLMGSFVDIQVADHRDAITMNVTYALRLKMDAYRVGRKLHIMTRVMAHDRPAAIWSRRAEFDNHEGIFESLELARYIYVIAEVAMQEVERAVQARSDDLRAGSMVARSLRDILSFDPDRLHRAEDRLKRAGKLSQNPIIPAWRSFLRAVISVEDQSADEAKLSAEARDLAEQALINFDGNPMVLSLLGHVRLLMHGQIEVGSNLSLDAVKIDPWNPFPYVGLSAALTRDGRHSEALATARRGRDIAAFSSFRHWWDFSCGLAELSRGNVDDAIRNVEASVARAPAFLAPQRYLYALYAFNGDEAKARQIAESLRLKEPDFSLTRMREDETYPAAILRRSTVIGTRDVD